jgi:DNA-binding PadR family transcriptional regulator
MSDNKPQLGNPEPQQAAQRRMGLDVLGEIQNTSVPASHSLLPIIEAIVNSIHATEDRFGDRVAEQGTVEVRFHRVRQQHMLTVAGRPPIEPVMNVTIVDNGTGFDDKNLIAFQTANTRAKAHRGGKGVGRFTWLVVFREATVQSTFVTGGQKQTRSFAFRRTEAGIEEFAEKVSDAAADVGTTIKLLGVEKRFEPNLRKGTDVLAEAIVEQCFHYFVLGRCPRVTLFDETAEGDNTVVLNERVQELGIDEPAKLTVGKHQLTVQHVQQPHAAGRSHKAHLCANQREVLSFPLAQISELGTDPLALGDGKLVVHHAFVSGAALDGAVDSTRTRLDLPDGLPMLEASGMLDMKSLREAVGQHVNANLATTLSAERDENRRRIEAQIRSQMPEYRHLIRHQSDKLARVRWTEDRQKLDESLYRLNQDWELEVRRRQAEVEQQLEVAENPDEIAERLFQVIQEVNDAGQANLVRYVSKRRAVLAFLNHLLGKGILEEHVHRIVFPLRKNGDEVSYEEHNLWLVDDSLSFYEFIASDKRLDSNKETTHTDSRRRPDVLAFKAGDAPYHQVALVEFKRPGRDDDNPVQQIVDYAVLLRNGGAQDAQGRVLPGIPKGVRIDAFAIATLSPALEAKLRTGPGNMEKVEGDWRWFGGVPVENLSIEVLDFQTFIKRAEQRNRAFFTKLGLP